ncbi:unnamed protein product [Brassicogethes aeneus]|uniref:Uncharacterized protein n=1 Tax=Brassicogethes aeneus TaxID=1431903 RepID=A0A9P0ANY3_BRAAE|nr:unnamed protein product [Brassicogethes aeneus]
MEYFAKKCQQTKEKEQQFTSELQNLFDIDHGHVLEQIDEQRREFLKNQRKLGRLGYINDIESCFDKLEPAKNQREELLRRKQSKSQVDIDIMVLDSCKVSYRGAVHLVAAIAEVLNFDVETLTINRTSIRYYRRKIREARATQIKNIFENTELNALVLHWNGKLLFDILKRETVERLPVLVSNSKTEKLLGVPALPNSKVPTQANAVYEMLQDWRLLESVKAFCCDRTSNLVQYEMTGEERTAVRDTSIFIVMLCIEAWFTAPHADMAPNHDLQLLNA